MIRNMATKSMCLDVATCCVKDTKKEEEKDEHCIVMSSLEENVYRLLSACEQIRSLQPERW